MDFIPYPAIDLKGGQVVRLKRGDMAQATVYGDPATQARAFDQAGFPWLHVVDLDGAFAGKPANVEAVRAILGATTRPVQLGGGIRDMATVEGWLEAGIARVILGSAAAKDPDFARAACRAHPGRVAIGIDARDGFVATEGWAETGTLTALDLGLMLEDAGAAAIIHTDIDRDGMLGGVNVAATAALAERLTTPVIASGGVAGRADLDALRATGTIAGVIIGRALYDGRLTAADALGGPAS
ncbi:1-(5-phosphoribosyl)-5-[(5-phosphoribosylamino)methylideneamino]imidazole-4-carboxamide isomerase [Roseomonas harenae]|jgi:phosphoribosylformimino-5-aminoimidazole carboxamide ribotide isomerase|uniref:1-(5-phosphoribosyl)-5-[(5- phosphoribosylamino)methylideneamino]imidazole-4- carboxamide isomerase n=1 Tax=Muricoccus harenae TaxID=2692566 RepID=UPI001331AD40|nr:1-(5-phosphoribosyl)-5-[(5-phosphoribosylamino)methylideneamino]imidazole-4-carboxamide isomerase [Roseomonas harenae]